MAVDIIKALQRVQEDASAALVDDQGKLTFLGCLFLFEVHRSITEFFVRYKNEKQNEN